MSKYSHIPVLQMEVVHFVLNSVCGGQGILVDCTVGEGGHTEFILKRFDNLHVIGFDRDRRILDIAKGRMIEFGRRVNFINDNFCNIFKYLDEYSERVNFFLYDFGISSFHLERSGRGFSFGRDEALDMRLDDGEINAYYIVNNYEKKKLSDIIYRYGEERWAKKISDFICERRKNKTIKTTGELADIVLRAIPRRFHVRNIHPATRVFQALRVAVNDELAAIEKSLDLSYKYLSPGGRIMAISFHSLEDRIVKQKFKRLARGCTCSADPKNCLCRNDPYVKILTKKPVTPEIGEIEKNSRARSAKMRVCEKI